VKVQEKTAEEKDVKGDRDQGINQSIWKTKRNDPYLFRENNSGMKKKKSRKKPLTWW